MPAAWGGRDNYEFNFEPEKRQKDMIENGTVHHTNNNDTEQANLNLLHRKVSQVHINQN